MRKFVVFMILMVALSGFAFAETSISFDVGMNLFYETRSNFVRTMFGNEQQFNIYSYNENSFVGFFIQETAGYYIDYENFSIGEFVGSKLALAGGPSFIIRHTNKNAYLTISPGLILQWYNERGNNNAYFVYNAFDAGILADLSFNIKLPSKLEFRGGASIETIFLRVGSNEGVNGYLGITLKPHIGIGTSF